MNCYTKNALNSWSAKSTSRSLKIFCHIKNSLYLLACASWRYYDFIHLEQYIRVFISLSCIIQLVVHFLHPRTVSPLPFDQNCEPRIKSFFLISLVYALHVLFRAYLYTKESWGLLFKSNGIGKFRVWILHWRRGNGKQPLQWLFMLTGSRLLSIYSLPNVIMCLPQLYRMSFTIMTFLIRVCHWSSMNLHSLGVGFYVNFCQLLFHE